MNDFDKLKQAQKMLEDGISEFVVAETIGIDLPTITELRISLQQKIQTQAVANRMTIRQSFRNKIPKALDKAIEIMNTKFDEVEGKEAKDRLALLKIQLDASKAILSLASQSVGEDFLSLYVEKPEKKKENFEVIYENQILNNGAIVMKARTRALEPKYANEVEQSDILKEETTNYSVKEEEITIDLEQ
jgi:hypothetical protein